MKVPRVLLALIAVMAAFGLAGPLAAQGQTGTQPVTSVGEYEILEREFEETYRAILGLYQRESGQRQPPEGLAEFRRGVLEQLIRQRLMRAEAKQRGVTIAESEAEQHLRQDPYFHPGGNFDLNLWAEFSSNPESYRRAMDEATELLAGRRLLEQVYRRLTPSDDELRAYYTGQNERVALNALLIDQNWFENDTDLSAAAIRTHYDSLSVALRGAENVFVELFIVRFPGELTGARSAASTDREARERADSVLTALYSGATYEQVAADFGGIRDGGIWAKDRETGVFYEDPELGEAALAAVAGEVLTRPLRVPGGYAIVRVKSKTERQAPPLATVAGAVINDYGQMRLLNLARSRQESIRQAHPDSFLTVCTTWNAALIDTSQLEVKEPDRRTLERWYEENRRDFARLDPEGKGLVIPPFEELEEMARDNYLSQEKIRLAEETAEKIAKAWGRGKRDKKQEKMAQVWYELSSTPEGPVPPGVPPLLADSAQAALVGYAGTLRGSRGFAVFAVSSRDESCPVSEPVALQRTARILADQIARDREIAARQFYDNYPERYITAPTYHYTAVDVDIRPWDIVDMSDAEIEAFYHANIADFGVPTEVRVRHILISTPPGRDTVQALARARDISDAARRGADFDSLARNFSEDPGTSERGGDTGFLTEAGTPPGFESFTQAAFRLSPGEVAGPVRTPFGYHVIQGLERKEGTRQPLDIVWPNVSSRLASTKADSIAQMAATRAITGFDSKQAMIEWADEENYNVMELSWRPGTRAIGPAAVAEVRQGLEAKVVPGALPEFYFVAPRYVVVYLDSIGPPQRATWEEAREQALYDVDRGRRLQASMRSAEEMLAEMSAGAGWEQAAAPWGGGTAGLEIGTGFVVEGMGHIAEMDTLLFGEPDRRLDDGDAALLSTDAGGLVIQVIQRRTVTPGDFAAVADSLRNQELEYALYEYFEQLKKKYPVRILRADLDVFLPSPPPLLSAVEPRSG
jgi:parvulin-like peptidyl-prolyl isomerase